MCYGYCMVIGGGFQLTGSTGGYIANVNMWSRKISTEVMSTMMWDGDLFSLDESTVDEIRGVTTAYHTFNTSGESLGGFKISLPHDRTILSFESNKLSLKFRSGMLHCKQELTQARASRIAHTMVEHWACSREKLGANLGLGG